MFKIFQFFKPITTSIVPLAVGMAGLSIASSIAGNSQAKANAEAQAKFIVRDFKVQQNNLTNTANELNRQIGMELTQVQLDGMKAQATTSNVLVEKEISGATAARIYNNVDMQESQISNQIKQKAESNMLDIQNQLTSSRYRYESNNMQNAINLSNNTQSGFEVASSAAQAGVSGYSIGSKL